MANGVTIRIELSAEALDRLLRPVSGRGGFQNLLRSLQRAVTEDAALVLTPQNTRMIARYVHAYGRGGFQGRLDTVLAELKSLAKALEPIAA